MSVTGGLLAAAACASEVNGLNARDAAEADEAATVHQHHAESLRRRATLWQAALWTPVSGVRHLSKMESDMANKTQLLEYLDKHVFTQS